MQKTISKLQSQRIILAGLLCGSALQASAAIVRYEFSATGTSQNAIGSTVNGYYALDTGLSDEEALPNLSNFGFLDDSPSPIVDFGVTINSSSGQSFSFFAQRAISNDDPSVEGTGQIINDYLVGVDPLGNDVLNDGFVFRVVDTGIFGMPPNPMFNTITTVDTVMAFIGANISVRGTSDLIQSLNPPESINFSTVFPESFLILEVNSLFTNSSTPQSDLLAGGVLSQYSFNNISAVQTVPIPTAVWLFSSALLGLSVIKHKKV